MKKMIYNVLNEMAECFSVSQLKKLQEVMLRFYLNMKRNQSQPVILNI